MACWRKEGTYILSVVFCFSPNLKIHKLLKVERDSQDRADFVLGFMPPQHMFFFSNLRYFVLGTMDSLGRPWASLVTGEQGFIRAVSQGHLAMVTELSEGDPL